MPTKSKYSTGIYKLKVRRGVSGKGLFAEEDIPKGVCLIEYIGKVVPEKEQYTIKSKYLFGVGKNGMINGNIPENTAKYINHSCKPNCEIEEYKNRIFVFSKKKILAGEELNYDYGKEYFDEYFKNGKCLCIKCKK
jgi:SET domain-containing protein